MKRFIALMTMFMMANCCVSQEFESLRIPATKSKRLTGACDFEGFVKTAVSLQDYRKSRLVSADKFVQLARLTNTIIVDARDPAAFEECHVRGSINLPYTNFTESTLHRVIPEKSTHILLYCRNNFQNDAVDKLSTILPFIEPKHAWAGLNIPTFVTLHIYGYQEVWELDDIVDPSDCAIEFVIASGNPKSSSDGPSSDAPRRKN